ncbi:hypothetical protein C8J56DRAFT_1024436 [Mycena floridula]|nr:hypothetical protein C8J56DRAFT_1024436 [Mycena floridula]
MGRTPYHHRAELLWLSIASWPAAGELDLERVWLRLLEDITESDVWLWVEDDEAMLEKRFSWPSAHPVPVESWNKALGALQKRQSSHVNLHFESLQHAELRRLTQSAEPEMRMAMIIWLVLTSKVLKRAFRERGCSDYESWGQKTLIKQWYSMIRGSDFLVRRSNAHSFRGFTSIMDEEQHTCHHDMKDALKPWLYMRSKLFSDAQNDALYLGCNQDNITCRGCSGRAAQYPLPWDNVIDLVTPPSMALVLLKLIWTATTSNHYPQGDFRRWISELGRSHRLPDIHAVISRLDLVDSLLEKLPLDPPTFSYSPWVNSFPRSFRSTIVSYTAAEWQELDRILSIDVHRRMTISSFDLHAWVGATILICIPGCLSPADRVVRFAETIRGIEHLRPIFGAWNRSPAVLDFRSALTKSPHICWVDIRHCADWYSAAMSVLDRTARVIGVAANPYEGYTDCSACIVDHLKKVKGEDSFTDPPHETFKGSHPCRNEAQPLQAQSRASPVPNGPQRAVRSKDEIAQKVKAYLISSIESRGIALDSIRGEKKLPWSTLLPILRNANLEIVHWPSDVPLPGIGPNASRGIGGLRTQELEKLYEAIHSRTRQLRFRRISSS